MWTNTRFSPDLVTFTEEVLNGKLHIFCSVVLQPLPELPEYLGVDNATRSVWFVEDMHTLTWEHLILS